MNRRRTGSVEHPILNKELPKGVADALNEANKEEELTSSEVDYKKPISELKDLVLFGKVEEEVYLGGYKFLLSTLKGREQRELLKKLLKLDNEERLMHIKEFTLSYALKSINSVPLEDLYDDGETNDVFQKRVSVISDMQASLVEKLFEKYDKLVGKANEVLDNDGVGGAVKN